MAHDHDHDHDHDHGHHHHHDEDGPAVTSVVEDLGPCKKLLKVEVAPDDVKKEISQRLEEVRRNVHLKGFRRGKAPRSLIERRYGDLVMEDARKHLLQQGYMAALKNDLGVDKVLGEGTIENVNFSRDEGLKFEITLHTRPEFELGDHKGVKVVVPKLVVEDKDLEAAVDQFRRTRGETQPVEDPEAVVEGEDEVEVTVEVWLADEYETWATAKEAGEAAPDLKPLKEETGIRVQLPSDYVGEYEVEDLADSLTGLKKGEWGDAETDLPEDYEVVEGRSEPAVLRIRVDSIRRLVLPELTEEWVKEAGYDSVADLKSQLREQLQQHQELARRYQVEQRVINRLLEQAGDFDLPADILEKEIENAERRKVIELRMQGKDEREAEEAAAEERDEVRKEVERMLRSLFVLGEVARREDIHVSERDLEPRIARIAAARAMPPKAVREQLESQRLLPQLRQELQEEKTRAFLREHAEIEESEDI